MAYRIEFEKRAFKELSKLPKQIQKKIFDAIKSLANDPRPSGCKKLKDRPGYRYRVGNYRVIYLVEDENVRVLVIKVGHRKDVYM